MKTASPTELKFPTQMGKKLNQNISNLNLNNYLNRVYLENCSSFRMKRKNPHPPAPSPFLGEGEPQSCPSPFLGEGFRARAKTTVLNIDEVYQVAVDI